MSASLRGADAAAIAARYGVPATAAVVVATRATAVALQFPDAFLADAPAVAAALSAAAAAEAAAATTAAAPAVEGAPAAAPLFYILGDSSHSPCCVDGIAAAHVNADLLVHYGEACLSAPPPLPVAYVFPPPAASVGRPARAAAIVDAAARLLRATTGVLSVVVTADLAAVGGGGGLAALADAAASVPGVRVAAPVVDLGGVVPAATPTTAAAAAPAVSAAAMSLAAATTAPAAATEAAETAATTLPAAATVPTAARGGGPAPLAPPSEPPRAPLGATSFALLPGEDPADMASLAAVAFLWLVAPPCVASSPVMAFDDDDAGTPGSGSSGGGDDAPGGSVALRNAMLRYRASPFYYLCPVLSPRVADDVAAVTAVTERVASVGLSAGDAAPVHPPFSSSADGLPPPTRASVGRLLSRRLRALGAATPGRRYGVLSSTAPGAGGRGALAAALSAVRASGRSAVGVAVGVPTVAKLSNFPDVAAWVGLDCPSGGGVAAVAPDLGVPVLTAGELAVLLTAEADAADADADDGLGDMADGGPPAEPVDADVALASAPWVAGVAEAVAPLVAVAARRWGRDVAAAVEEAAATANGGVGGAGQVGLRGEWAVARGPDGAAAALAAASWQGLDAAAPAAGAPTLPTRGRVGVAAGYAGEGGTGGGRVD